MNPREDKPAGTADLAGTRPPREADRRPAEANPPTGSSDEFEGRPSPAPSAGERAGMETGSHAASRRDGDDDAFASRSFPGARGKDAGPGHGPLLQSAESSGFRERWEECQRSFVDEPRESVKHADELVAEVMQKLAGQFAETRSSLEHQWDRGDNVSTEDLRVALQRYRDFFNRLLAA